MNWFAVSIYYLKRNCPSYFSFTIFDIFYLLLTYFFRLRVWQVAALFYSTYSTLLFSISILLSLLFLPVCIVIGLSFLKLNIVSPKFYSSTMLLFCCYGLYFLVTVDFGLLIKVWYLVLLQNVVFLGLKVENLSLCFFIWILFGALESIGAASITVRGIVYILSFVGFETSWRFRLFIIVLLLAELVWFGIFWFKYLS